MIPSKMASENEVKKLISSVMCSSPTGLTIKNLNYDFKNLVGILIPFKSFGYPTLESYLRTIPDVCQIIGSGEYATLTHVVSQNLKHIDAMIINQKVSKTSRQRVTYRRPKGIISKPSIGYNSESSNSEIMCRNHIKFNGNHQQQQDYSTPSTSSCDESQNKSYSKKCPTKYADLARFLYTQKKLDNVTINEIPRDNSISELIKQRLSIIITQYPTGLASSKLPELYKSRFKEDLDPYNFNCNSISELCRVLNNEVFYIVRLNLEDLLLFDINLPKPDPEDFVRCDPFNFKDYPFDVMILKEKLDLQSLYYSYKTTDSIPLTVIHIVDPSNFYFQYDFNYKFVEKRNQFFEDLQIFYSHNAQKYIVRSGHILHSLYCVALVNEVYYRAIIKKRLKNNVEVFLIDYGDTEIVDRSYVYYLANEFSLLSRQAVAARLSRIKPVNGNEWSEKANAKFYDMVESRETVGRITGNVLGKVCIVITDVTDPDTDIFVNDTLIDEGFAEFTANN